MTGGVSSLKVPSILDNLGNEEFKKISDGGSDFQTLDLKYTVEKGIFREPR